MEKTVVGLNALVCDLDGTLLHGEQESISVQGRTRASFLSKNAALLLQKISKIFPVVIATGRNSKSVHNLVKQLPEVIFRGFVLENGFVAKHKIENGKLESDIGSHWDNIAALFPEWERLPFYENCVGFIFASGNSNSFSFTIDIDKIALYAEKILIKNGYNYLVYKEKKKIFIYPGHVNKMRGLALLGVHPYIAMGDGINDIQMMQHSNVPITLGSGASELKKIVKEKSGFCSMEFSHNGASEMLDFAYTNIQTPLRLI